MPKYAIWPAIFADHISPDTAFITSVDWMRSIRVTTDV